MRKAAICLMAGMMLLASSATAHDWWKIFSCSKGIKGSGDLVTEERDVKAFTKIKSSGSFDIFVTVGSEQSVSVTFDDNLIEYIITEVRGKTLKIYSDESINSRHDCRIEITAPSLESVRLSGSGDVEVVNLDQDFFEYSVSGSGDMRAEGKVMNLEVSVSGSGDIDTRELEAQDAVVTVSGSGDVRVYASQSLDARVSGSGDISYYGDPDDVSSRVSGSGSIKKRR
ncbi:MAG: DUF2807 domain-containing protein [Candidatus Zixiibacteriota bacterium]|nr:MAG: DUF2807 domain-containing protein [candidate division Zixibacteria bacterium]